MNELVYEIDLSDVKIWSKKKKYFVPFVKPQSLVLFPENSNKCKYCGFYESVCMCFIKQKRQYSILSIKESVVSMLTKIRTKYHSIMKDYFEKKYDSIMKDYFEKKYDRLNKKVQKISNKVYFHRHFNDSNINWKEVELKGIEIKMSGGL